MSHISIVTHVEEGVKATDSTVTEKCCKMHKDFSARNTILTDLLKNDGKLTLKMSIQIKEYCLLGCNTT
jgi:hypothetical protein